MTCRRPSSDAMEPEQAVLLSVPGVLRLKAVSSFSLVSMLTNQRFLRLAVRLLSFILLFDLR